MSSQAPTPDATPDQTAEDAQYYRGLLHGIMDMANNLARAVHDRALDQAEPPTPEQALTFDRIARVVRRSILLARHVAQPLPLPAAAPADHRVAARKRILRAVEDTIGHVAGAGGKAEALHAEFLDRLEAPDLDEEIDGRPVKDVIADILQDLGIYNQPGFTPYKRRTPDDVARLAARAATPAAKPRQPATPRARLLEFPPPARSK